MTKYSSYEHTFYKTFSGADSLAFMLLPDCKPILLGSLTTVSYSMYRDKKPVTLIGKINVSGYTRGMRVIAGTMIFTLINQHLTKDLVDQVSYLSEHGKIKADELPLFDVMVISSNEYGASTRMMIYGIDITDDAQVLSVEDMFTENTFNFVARDLDEFTAYKDTIVSSSVSRQNTVDAIMPYDFDISNYETTRQFIYSNIKNEELLSIQSELVRKGLLYKKTGVYDNDTLKAIKKVQIENGLNQTGMLDKTTYDLILSNEKDTRELITIKRSGGAFVYSDISKTKVNGIVKHKETFLANKEGDFYKISFYDSDGYIEKSDVIYDIKYKLTCYSDPATIYINDGIYDNVGFLLNSSIDMDLKVSAICKYEDNKKEVFSKYIQAQSYINTNVILSDFTDAYIYNIAHKSKPKEIIFIALSQGIFIHKWKVIVGGES